MGTIYIPCFELVKFEDIVKENERILYSTIQSAWPYPIQRS